MATYKETKKSKHLVLLKQTQLFGKKIKKVTQTMRKLFQNVIVGHQKQVLSTQAPGTEYLAW